MSSTNTKPTTTNAPIWPFHSHTFPLLLADQLAQSPSCQVSTVTPPTISPLIRHPLAVLRQRKLSLAAEKQIRGLYISLLMKAGRLLELPNLCIATACVYWHRFFSLHSLLIYHPSLCAAAAIFLASKVEENTRRVRDIINVIHRVEFMTNHSSSQLINPASSSPHHSFNNHHSLLNNNNIASTAASSNPTPIDSPLEVSQLFWDLKEEVLRFEQKLLRVLNYEMKIYHPHLYILHFAREIECSEELCRYAYYLANDSMKTTLCLQYTPNAIACACLYLSSEMMNEQIRFHPPIMKESLNSSANTLTAASASPYRSPHHHHHGPSSLTNSLTSSGNSSLAGLITTSHSNEWWEYFGKVNQLEIEDIAHQLLDHLEEADVDTSEQDGMSIHAELQRICEEEDRAQQQQQQRLTHSTEDHPMEDDTVTPTPSTTQASRPSYPPAVPASRTPTHHPKFIDRRPQSQMTTPTTAATTNSLEYPSYSSVNSTGGGGGSGTKPPQRLQLHPSRPFMLPATAMTSSAGTPAAPIYSSSSYTPSSVPPSYGSAYTSSTGSTTKPNSIYGASIIGSGGGATLTNYSYAVPPSTAAPLPPAITIMGGNQTTK